VRLSERRGCCDFGAGPSRAAGLRAKFRWSVYPCVAHIGCGPPCRLCNMQVSLNGCAAPGLSARSRPGLHVPLCIDDMNRIRMVLLDINNRIVRPFLAGGAGSAAAPDDARVAGAAAGVARSAATGACLSR
jgi:hypothetical protein